MNQQYEQAPEKIKTILVDGVNKLVATQKTEAFELWGRKVASTYSFHIERQVEAQRSIVLEMSGMVPMDHIRVSDLAMITKQLNNYQSLVELLNLAHDALNQMPMKKLSEGTSYDVAAKLGAKLRELSL